MKIHFIGIGGIGVSALAQYYLVEGHDISGSDLVFSEITDHLKKRGIKIFNSQFLISGRLQIPKSKLPNLVIYSPAVKATNPELKFFKNKGIKCQSYPEALGELTKKYFTIAVSGTHGKSTITAMISLILKKANFEPTVILGTKLKEFGDSNCRVGKPVQQAHGKIQYLVIEADEWGSSFLHYWPKIIVLSNIEKEHLDFYKDLNHILKTYREYISHLPKDGVLILNRDDKISYNKFSTIVENIVYFSLKQKEARKLKKILQIPGKHNISNALAALTLARVLKIPDKISFKVLSEYRGAWRRFEEHNFKIKDSKFKIISDYGHHPTELIATLKGVKEKYPKKKVWFIFQPHQYQRTYYLFDDFVKVFRKPLFDLAIITDIFDVSGREEKEITREVNSKKLVEKINRKNVIYLSKDKIVNYLKNNLKGERLKKGNSRLSFRKETGVVIIMGAGDIYQLVEQF